MAYVVLEANAATIQKLEADDVVGRQSLTVRDGEPWGIVGKVVMVSGTEEGVARARAMAEADGARVSPKAEHVKKALDDEADASAGGVGFIFGP